MRKVSFLIAVCFVLAVMVATIAAQAPAGGAPAGAAPGGPGGGGRGGGQRGPAAPAPTGPAPTGANGLADLAGPNGLMQRISATNRGMGGKVTAGDAAGVAEDLGALQSLFMAAQTAFIKEKATGPADLAKVAATAAGDAQKVAKAGKVDAATTKAVTDSCAGCHTPYRIKDASGAYQIKTQ